MDIKQEIKKMLQGHFLRGIVNAETKKLHKLDNKDKNKTALLFFIKSKTDLDQLREVVKTARKNNNHSFPIIFSGSSSSVDVITDRDFFIFNADDFSYNWKPKQHLKQWLEDNKFDLLINFDHKGMPEATLLYALIQSNFRIANQHPNNFHHNDLTINTKEKQIDLVTFYNLAIDNLKMLNINRN